MVGGEGGGGEEMAEEAGIPADQVRQERLQDGGLAQTFEPAQEPFPPRPVERFHRPREGAVGGEVDRQIAVGETGFEPGQGEVRIAGEEEPQPVLKAEGLRRLLVLRGARPEDRRPPGAGELRLHLPLRWRYPLPEGGGERRLPARGGEEREEGGEGDALAGQGLGEEGGARHLLQGPLVEVGRRIVEPEGQGGRHLGQGVELEGGEEPLFPAFPAADHVLLQEGDRLRVEAAGEEGVEPGFRCPDRGGQRPAESEEPPPPKAAGPLRLLLVDGEPVGDLQGRMPGPLAGERGEGGGGAGWVGKLRGTGGPRLAARIEQGENSILGRARHRSPRSPWCGRRARTIHVGSPAATSSRPRSRPVRPGGVSPRCGF